MTSESAVPIANQAIVATHLTKWFGEGESKTIAVKDIGLVAHFGEMLFIVGSFRQRQDHCVPTPAR